MPLAQISLLPATAEVVAVAGYVLLAVFFTAELLKGPPSPARRAFAAFNGLVAVNRLVYLASLITPAAAAWWHVAEAVLLGTGALLLLFAYAYGGPAFPREGRVLVGLTVAAMAVFLAARLLALGTGEPRYLFEHVHFAYELPAARTLGAWPFRVLLLAVFGWAAVVLARKGWRPPASWPATTDDEARARPITGARILAVIFLTGALAPVFRAAEYAGWIPLGAFSGILVVLLALSVIVFTTYASEPTSLQFRLTAVSMSVVVAVLTLASGVLSQSTAESAREARIALAGQVRQLAEVGALDADRLPDEVAYVVVREGGQERIMTRRPGLTLAVLDADARAARSGRALPSAATPPDVGPDWASAREGVPAEWSRGALAPPARRFDAVAVQAGERAYEVGVPHAVLRGRLGEVNAPILALLVLVTGAIWGGAPLLFRGSLLGPVRRLRDGIARVEGGDLGVRVPAPANDEIGDLGRSFNRMTEALATAREREAEAAQAEARAARLRELDAVKSQFFANVSHEFRTPLTLTLGPLDDVLDGPDDLGDDTRELLALAQRNARRLLGLVNQVLDVAKMEAGAVELDPRPLDLGALAASVAEALRAEADRKGLALTVRQPSEPVGVLGEAARLDQALGNLVANAVKFTPTGGAVRVEVRAEGDTAVVAVGDTGPGIDPAERPYVFDRFYQAASAAASATPGTGIGLALAREVAELHGGTLAVEGGADADGRPVGSVFTLQLPHHDLAAASDGSASEPPVLASAETEASDGDDVTTVLVVEDNDELRAYVRRQLEQPARGPAFRVIEAADGEAGLAAARAHLPDLVVSDLMMPVLDGLGLVRALRADSATDFLPVVLLTARADRDDRLAGLAADADAYLTKPFDPDELRAVVGNLIASRQRLRERFAAPLASGAGAVAPASPPAPPADDDFLDAVARAIDARLSDPGLSVEALADAVGVSRGHLHRQLKAGGRTPSAAIREARLARAAKLLEAREGTVSEVAYGVGFKSVSHFSRVFREAFGRTPSEVAAGDDEGE